jgi:hypothetical protein
MSSSEGLSKLELVKANKLMRPEQIGFIKKIGEIRNRLAHDVDMIEGFKFQDHIASLDKNQLGQWKLCLSRSLSTRDEGDAEDYFNLAESEPRYIISAGLLDVLCLIEGSKAEFLAHSKAEEVAKVDTLEILESYQAKSGLKSEEYSYTFSIELDDTI